MKILVAVLMSMMPVIAKAESRILTVAGKSSKLLNEIESVAFDKSGNLFVASGDSIFKISPSKEITLFAQSDYSATTDANKSHVKVFGNLRKIAVDKNGNIFAIDGSIIRKITAEGVASVYAGQWNIENHQDGDADHALLNEPNGLALDNLGNVYFAESNSNTIRKITPDRKVITIAGSQTGASGLVNGNASEALFNSPTGIVIDSKRNIFIADSRNNVIRKMTPDGKVSTFAGSGEDDDDDGIGQSASFRQPDNLIIDQLDNLYVRDVGVIRKITPQGVVSSIPKDSIQFDNAKFLFAKLIAAPNGKLLLCTTYGNIYEVLPDGHFSFFINEDTNDTNDGLGADARFSYPNKISLSPQGNLFVTEDFGRKLRKITPSGTVTTVFSQREYYQRYVVDENENIYFSRGNTVIKITLTGTETVVLEDNRLKLSYVAAIGSDKNIYIVSEEALLKLTPSGILTTIVQSASLRSIDAVTVDQNGNVYVARAFLGYSYIWKISPDGKMDTLVDSPRAYADGSLKDARFSIISGMSFDRNGNLLIADSGNNRIRMITTGGIVSTIFGKPNCGTADGDLSFAGVCGILDLVSAPDGSIYLIANNTLRKIEF